MKKYAVILNEVSIEFPMSFDVRPSVRSQAGFFVKNKLLNKNKNKPQETFKALHKVSIKIGHSDIVGIIGPNGGGKTTLLRAIAGIYYPDKGSVIINGKLSTLLSLGTGLNNNLSGRDNILIGALLMGLKKKQVELLSDEIIKYADLGKFIDVPMKFYSNGMFSRLGFAIAMSLKADILLIDEVFSVGDLAFSKKSEKTMQKLLSEAKCQLIVTHDLKYVRENCTRAIYLQSGSIIADGSPNDVVNLYESNVEKENKE